jgi:hypothetical protein
MVQDPIDVCRLADALAEVSQLLFCATLSGESRIHIQALEQERVKIRNLLVRADLSEDETLYLAGILEHVNIIEGLTREAQWLGYAPTEECP